MSGESSIIHADVDAFFASVEQRDDPRLRRRAVIVGTHVVMAASYEARAHGVRGGMRAAEARLRCGDAVWVEPRSDAYLAASRALFELFGATAAVVEPGSMEEAFLDLRGHRAARGEPAARAYAIAERLRREVREQLGLPLTAGVAQTKVLAKLASRMAKPDGLMVVPRDRERALLQALPIERLWGVGPATAAKLHARGLRTAGQVARVPEGELMRLLGKPAGRYVHAAARGRDLRPVQPLRQPRSVSAQRVLGRATRSPGEIDAVVAVLVERVARRMARGRRAGRSVTLRVRFPDGTHTSRSHTMAYPACAAEQILSAARGLLAAAMPLVARRGITLVGVAVGNLDGGSGARQLALSLEPPRVRGPTAPYPPPTTPL